MAKEYRIGFQLWGLVLFAVIMIPNLIWFAVPAPNDVLRTESATEALDTVASICQAIMVASLCVVMNKRSGKLKWSPLTFAICVSCLIYFIVWVFYYAGVVNAPVILLLCLAPSLAFLFMAIERKNLPALIPAVLFTIGHLVYGVVNFIL